MPLSCISEIVCGVSSAYLSSLNMWNPPDSKHSGVPVGQLCQQTPLLTPALPHRLEWPLQACRLQLCAFEELVTKYDGTVCEYDLGSYCYAPEAILCTITVSLTIVNEYLYAKIYSQGHFAIIGLQATLIHFFVVPKISCNMIR